VKISELRKMMNGWPDWLNPADEIRRNQYLRSLGMEPGDIYQELEMDSQFIDTHRDHTYANMSVNLHSHNFYELLYCRNCDNVEYLVGTDRYCLRKGDVLVIPPGISHRPLLPEVMKEPYIRDVLWINAGLIELLQRWFPKELEGAPLSSTLLSTEGSRWERLGELFDRGVRERGENGDDCELAVLGNTIILLTELRRACADRQARPQSAEKPELMDRVVAYVAEHLDKKITLSEVAHHFYISESTISQTFNKKMGVSFYRYVTQRRLITAKSLIEKGLQMEEVGVRSGFSDYSTFYRAFKHEFGISPRQYRKLQQSHSDPVSP
jgi:AraC-like DNA-binding protein